MAFYRRRSYGGNGAGVTGEAWCWTLSGAPDMTSSREGRGRLRPGGSSGGLRPGRGGRVAKGLRSIAAFSLIDWSDTGTVSHRLRREHRGVSQDKRSRPAAAAVSGRSGKCRKDAESTQSGPQGQCGAGGGEGRGDTGAQLAARRVLPASRGHLAAHPVLFLVTGRPHRSLKVFLQRPHAVGPVCRVG